MLEGELFVKLQSLCQGAAKATCRAKGPEAASKGASEEPDLGRRVPSDAADTVLVDADDDAMLGEADIDEELVKTLGAVQSKRELLDVFVSNGWSVKRPKRSDVKPRSSG